MKKRRRGSNVYARLFGARKNVPGEALLFIQKAFRSWNDHDCDIFIFFPFFQPHFFFSSVEQTQGEIKVLRLESTR